MPRRILFVVALAATILVACGGPAAAPALTDPKDVVVQAASSLQTLKTVHLKVSLAGKVDAGALSGKPTGSMVDLAGSTLEGDLDVAGGATKLTAAVPAILGLSADLVVDAGTVYLKTSLTGALYQKLDLAAISAGLPLPSLPTMPSPDPSAAAQVIATIKAELDKLPAPVKLADEKVGDQDCYHVQEKLASTDVPQAAAILADFPGTLTVDVWTRKSDYRPARLVLAIDGGTAGTGTITVDLTAYDAAVTIAAPPADQISDQPFAIPGLPTLP